MNEYKSPESVNILLTSAGRRGYLADYFKAELGEHGRVFASNSEMTSALRQADGWLITPLIYDEGYIPCLLDYCEKMSIRAVIPLLDIDLMVLAQNRERFEERGITVIVSDPDVIRICNDKWKMCRFLTDHGLSDASASISLEEVLQGIQEGTLHYPLVIKPRFGMGSIDVFTAEDEAELKVLCRKCQREIRRNYLRFESSSEADSDIVLIQQYIRGEEYGLDIINDLNGEYVTTIVRKKLAMRAGETDIAEIVEDAGLEELGKKLSASLKHIGNLDVDVMVTPDSCCIIDMNARFGGGYPFSHMAGVNLPRAIIAWLRGEKAEEEWFRARKGLRIFKIIDMAIL